MTAAKSMTQTECLDLALEHAERGFPVFPIKMFLDAKGKKIEKKPHSSAEFTNGFHDATTDAETITRMFRATRLGPREHPGVALVPAGGNRLVLDVDVKDKGVGLKSLAEIESKFGALPGRRIRTPSKGLHIYLTIPPGTELGQTSPWPSIDVRCEKGYVVAPGVTSPWGAWEVESGEPGDAPALLLEAIRQAETARVSGSAPLVTSGGEKIKAGGRNPALFSEARSFNRRGYAFEETVEHVELFNARHCDPPHDRDEVVRTVTEAYSRYEQGRPEPIHVNKSVAVLPQALDHRSPLEFVSIADLCAQVDAAGPRRYLVRGIWPAGAYGVHAADMKAQKTWNVYDLGVSVASGTRWFGHHQIDDPGPVLLFVGEGGTAATVRRIRAICDSRGLRAEDLPITICVRAPHLTDDDHMTLVANELDAIRPKLVSVDPLYLSAKGGDGKDLIGMGTLLERAQIVCEEADTALICTTHFNRGNRTGAHRITGAGPAEWGRVIIGSEVKSRHTHAVTKATTVVAEIDVMGGEIADTEFRVKRVIWADDPDDLDSPLHYQVEATTEQNADEDNRPPAQRKLLEAVRALGAGHTHPEIVDWIAEAHGHGLTRPTVSAGLNALRADGLVDSVETPGKATLWMPVEVSSRQVDDTPTTGSQGAPLGVLSSSSHIDDDTPTPRHPDTDPSPRHPDDELPANIVDFGGRS